MKEHVWNYVQIQLNQSATLDSLKQPVFTLMTALQTIEMILSSIMR